ncbi:MAG: alanine dehydrogenase [Victivallaceae bacterium]
MIIGLPKEIKHEEYRVGLTPESAGEYVKNGHRVLVETGAGVGSGFTDADYVRCGCEIETSKKRLFDNAEMIVKVKEPLPEEYELFHENQILFTYLHLAADKPQAEGLLRRKVKAVAYETIMEADRSLPLLVPMSQIAGRLSIQEGAKCLEKHFGGEGILLGGVPGVRRGNVVILGGGVAGTNAAKVALGIGADVTIMDISAKRLAELDDIFGGRVKTLFASDSNIAAALPDADLVIGAVLIPGAAAPKLVRREHLKTMRPGSVLVDIAIDQGGCVETSHATSHSDPVFVVDGVIHYCVANMPGAVSRTSTLALTSVTNRYGLKIAGLGLEKAVASSPAIRGGLNCYCGKLTNEPVARALDLPYWDYSA